jgi:NADH:ubiquinone oxidoreductase subunit 4 (subunit M)
VALLFMCAFIIGFGVLPQPMLAVISTGVSELLAAIR